MARPRPAPRSAAGGCLACVRPVSGPGLLGRGCADRPRTRFRSSRVSFRAWRCRAVRCLDVELGQKLPQSPGGVLPPPGPAAHALCPEQSRPLPAPPRMRTRSPRRARGGSVPALVPGRASRRGLTEGTKVSSRRVSVLPSGSLCGESKTNGRRQRGRRRAELWGGGVSAAPPRTRQRPWEKGRQREGAGAASQPGVGRQPGPQSRAPQSRSGGWGGACVLQSRTRGPSCPGPALGLGSRERSRAPSTRRPEPSLRRSPGGRSGAGPAAPDRGQAQARLRLDVWMISRCDRRRGPEEPRSRGG